MTVRILTGDVRDMLATLPDESVHCVVTSPPYWGLRDYGVDGQIGMEPTMGEHIETMVAVFREVRRVLRKDGTVWLNYGDCYATAPNGRSAADTKAVGNDDRTFRDKPFSTIGPILNPDRANVRQTKHPNGTEPRARVEAGGYLKPKDLCMTPNRLAIALQDDGWWVRKEIIWHKPNCMPESATDRPTSSHEKIWLLTKSAKYFYDAEAVRRPLAPGSIDRYAQDIDSQEGSHRANGGTETNGTMKAVGGPRRDKQRGHSRRHAGFNDRWDAMDKAEQQAKGANLRDVWIVPTKGFSGAHYATFPPDLIVPCIKAGASEKGCCTECGAPWVRETEYRLEPTVKASKRNMVGARDLEADENHAGSNRSKDGHVKGWRRADLTLGWSPSCTCDAATIPCTVLDPFIGSGTTAMVADRLGRDCIGIDLNPANVEMSLGRIKEDAGMFAEVGAE